MAGVGTRSTGGARLGLAAVTVGLAAAGAVPLWLGDRLPPTVATHWDLSGRPDASGGAGSLTASAAVVLAAAALLASLQLWAPAVRFQVAAATAFFAGLVGGMGAIVSLTMAAANAGAEHWADARLSPLVLVPVVLLPVAAPFAAGWAATGLGRRPPPVERALDLQAAAARPWRGTCRVRWAAAAAAAMAAAGVVCLAAGLAVGPRVAPLGAVLLVTALVFVPFGSVEVVLDDGGLRVAFGRWRWPVVRIPAERIAAVSAIDVRPLEWGGWGYRGSLRGLGRAAVVLRAGPGLRVDLTDGTVFAVTVDDPAQAVARVEGREAPGAAAGRP